MMNSHACASWEISTKITRIIVQIAEKEVRNHVVIAQHFGFWYTTNVGRA